MQWIFTIEIQHYQGPMNPTPPTTHDSIPYLDTLKRIEDVTLALNADIEWLIRVLTNEGDENPPVNRLFTQEKKGLYLSPQTTYIIPS